MDSPAGEPDQGQLVIHRVRIYYDPASGDILHVHQVASSAADNLSEERINEELDAFDEALRARDPRVEDFIEADSAAIVDAMAPDVNLHVDVDRQVLVQDTGPAASS
jgi:hypothetical protein